MDIPNSIVYIQSTRAIWLDLEVLFVQSNIPKLFHPGKEISHISQGTLSISAYFTKFRTLHDELECITAKQKCTCTLCTCVVNTNLTEFDQNLQLTQFLMGLNDSFTAIRGQNLMMKPLPSLNQSYGIMLQEDKQRETISSVTTNTENMAMEVKQYSSVKTPNKNLPTPNRKGTYSSIVCDYCHMTGHVIERCYCIHGYPTWQKLFGKPKPKPRFLKERSSVVANVSTTSTCGVAGSKSPSAGGQQLQPVSHKGMTVYSL